jgi:phosphatidylinositol-3,4,5-trisphosphate 3-phosphatase/dual-specificity protein phosphatase PTEN
MLENQPLHVLLVGLDFGLRLSPKSPAADDILEGTSSTSQSGIFGKLTKRLVNNTSKNTVKAL